jgi:hypothetical protein
MSESDAPLMGLCVLVLEGDDVAAFDLAAELESRGAEVLGPAPDIADAMTLLTVGRAPDVALLNVSLGKEMVFPLADWLEQAHIPFVFATGYERATIPDPYKSHDRLEKPYDMQELTRALVGARHRVR